METDIAHIRDVAVRSTLLFSKDAVENAVAEMAFKIESALSGTDPLCLTVMIGGLIATGTLLRRLHFPLEIDYIHATRYKGKTRGGEIEWLATPKTNLKNRTVLLIDDILDGGQTLAAIKEYCESQGAKKVYTAVLITKQKQRDPNSLQQADFSALSIEDRYIYGYGMDYQEFLRNAPGIFAVPKDCE
jgi:hypoxanthine phosphoribosyltransferase